MEKNEVKKALYKEKPKAKISYVSKESIVYVTTLENGKDIHFDVPLSDIGDAKFHNEMEAQLLNRYIS